jgi:diadenosine tetraphosphate (Ap4A) HIT family hydrolase
MSSYILNQTRTKKIEVHSDPLCIRPAAISKSRKFKINKLEQEELIDSEGGAEKCRFCNPELLDQNLSGTIDDPVIKKHLDGRVISYENAAPFLAGDQRLICMWHENTEIRYKHTHKYLFSDMTTIEFYYLLLVAKQLAKDFPTSPEGHLLQSEEYFPIRCIAGFNIGKLAGQSMPHFHLQYGWDVILPGSANLDIDRSLMNLYYSEMSNQNLILWEDDDLYVIAPWTPKGQFHMEIHFKEKYELTQLSNENIKILSFLSNQLMRIYESLGIRNINIIYTGSPYEKERMPFHVQFIPRSNTTALYEMVGVNVVDTSPSEIASRFEIKWRDVMANAKICDIEELYANRFA